ncbi:MAG TPA: hypothetical protein VJG32_06420 [Anaerolineae bacterium]|nr:hypothetical protein [Anaerolineae bacterium]
MSETGRKRPRLLPELPEAFRTHLKTARAESRQALQHLLPESFWEHRRAARREALLAIRSLIDDALERTEKKP